MKDAMGELNMTVVTIVAIGAVAAFFMGVMWPNIQKNISGGWQKTCVQYDKDGNCVSWKQDASATPNIVLPDFFDIPNIYE